MDEAWGSTGLLGDSAAGPRSCDHPRVLSEGREVNGETKKEKSHLHMGRLSS